MKELFLKWRLFAFELMMSLATTLAILAIPTSALGIDPLRMALVWFVAGVSQSLPLAWFLRGVSQRTAELGWLVSQLILAWYFVRWILGFQDPACMNFVICLSASFISFLILGGVTINSFFKQERF